MKKGVFVILFFILNIANIYSQENIILAKDGVIDLQNFDFDNDGIISLSGEWEFYWEQLLTPEDFKTENLERIFIQVPGVWKNGKNSASEKFPAYGFATYRLTILLPHNYKDVKFNVSAIRSAYKIWINDSLCYSCGSVGKNKENHKPGLFSFEDFYLNQDFNYKNDTVFLLIQVSNYTLPLSTGIKNGLYIGSSKSILKTHQINNNIGFFAIGIFLIIGFYHIILFLFRKKEVSSLIFGLGALAIIPRVLFSQQILEGSIHNFGLFWRLIILGAILFLFFLNLYFYILFKKEYGKKAIKFMLTIGFIGIATSFLSPSFTDRFSLFYFFIIIAPTIYIILIVMPRALINKQKFTFWAFAGIIAIGLTSTLDFFRVIGVSNLPYLATYGFIAFTFMQSINLSNRFSVALSQNEDLNIELKLHNENLEKTVQERTKIVNNQKNALVEQNEELVQLSEQLKMQGEELKATSEELKAQSVKLQTTNEELEKLSIVASHTDNAVSIFDDNFLLEWANNAFFRLYDTKLEEIIKESMFSYVSDKNIEDKILEAVKNKKSLTYQTSLKNNSNIWTQTTITPIYFENILYKIVAIESDITQLKLAEAEISEQKAVITSSIRYASTIQQAILPQRSEMKKYFDYFVLYKPKDIVSGDFYWFEVSPTNNQEVFVAVADCTGHGVPGAFMSMIGNTLLSEIVLQKQISDSNKILSELNRQIIFLLKQTSTKNSDGMDVTLCRINLNQKKIWFSGAKRPLFFYNSKTNELTRFKGDIASIGGLHSNKNQKFTIHEIKYDENDIIYLSSDGYIDQNRIDNKKFGTQNLMKLLKECATLPIDAQSTLVSSTLDNWQENLEQRDDITILGIKL